MWGEIPGTNVEGRRVRVPEIEVRWGGGSGSLR